MLADDLPDGWQPPPANSLLTEIGFGTREKIAKRARERLRVDLVAQGGSDEQADAVLDAISSGVPPEVLIAAAEEWRLQRCRLPRTCVRRSFTSRRSRGRRRGQRPHP